MAEVVKWEEEEMAVEWDTVAGWQAWAVEDSSKARREARPLPRYPRSIKRGALAVETVLRRARLRPLR
ncbi:MAG: hypothetical protein U9Q23_04055 [Candidatus Bipolaricaulota bacterium]|nr:hypothetical protein [Candidatus Bipolaricaulota bacterium]